MKECDIVQDLLIGYNDGTLKEGSKDFVEKHLKECSSCKNIFDEMKNDDIQDEENLEIDYLKKINKKNSKKNICIISLIILAVIIVALNVIIFKVYDNINAGMEVFLNDDITDEQLENICQKILSKDKNAEITYRSKEENFESFKNRLKNENVLEGYEGEYNIFPASLIIKFSNSNIVENIEIEFKTLEGVKNLTFNKIENPYVLFFGMIVAKIKNI